MEDLKKAIFLPLIPCKSRLSIRLSSLLAILSRRSNQAIIRIISLRQARPLLRCTSLELNYSRLKQLNRQTSLRFKRSHNEQ
jgi:hypothetical protein